MKHRKLRIAWSVAWGIVAVLLLVLWVLNYSREYSLERPYKTSVMMFQSVDSAVGFALADTPIRSNGWKLFVNPAGYYKSVTQRRHPRFTWSYLPAQNYFYVTFPDWFLIAIFSMLAAAPWTRSLPYRFSLRTLLIATTLVAVGLGLIVWLR